MFTFAGGMCVIIFHSSIYLLLTADYCFVPGIVRSVSKGNALIKKNEMKICMMEWLFCSFFNIQIELVSIGLIAGGFLEIKWDDWNILNLGIGIKVA